MQHTENAKLKVLALGDYGCSTGFATVMSNIMRELDKTGRFEIDVVGINYTGDPYDQKKFPGKVWPAMNIATAFSGDVYGRQRYLDFLGSGNYDIAFILQDTFIVKDMMDAILETQKNILKKFKTILYSPVVMPKLFDFIAIGKVIKILEICSVVNHLHVCFGIYFLAFSLGIVGIGNRIIYLCHYIINPFFFR